MKQIPLIFLFCVLGFTIIAQKSFTYESFLSEVLSNDFGIQLIKNDLSISENNNNIGAAGYLPRISIDARQDLSINSARQEFLSGQINEANNARNRDFNIGGLLEWTFFDGFKMFATDKKLDQLEETARLNLRAEIEMKMYEASITFFTFLLLEEMKQTYETAVNLSIIRFKDTQNKFKNGVATKIELIQSRLDLTADSSALIQNEKELANIKVQLNQLIASSPDEEIEIQGELPKTQERFDWKWLVDQLKEKNTQLLIAKSNIAIREQENKEAMSRFYPQLGFYAGYNLNTAQNEVGFLLSNRVYGPSFGLTMRWDILNQLSRYQTLKNAKINLHNAELIEKEQTLFIESELQKAFNNYEWSSTALNFELRNKESAEEIAEISKQAFEAGTLTNLELREIQFSIVEAQRRILTTQIDYITAKLNLQLQTGVWGSM